jgi:hypothetical protein
MASRSVCGPASRALETTSSAAAAGAGVPLASGLRSATTAASNGRLMEIATAIFDGFMSEHLAPLPASLNPRIALDMVCPS